MPSAVQGSKRQQAAEKDMTLEAFTVGDMNAVPVVQQMGSRQQSERECGNCPTAGSFFEPLTIRNCLRAKAEKPTLIVLLLSR
jgi:hypothetical protein